MPFAANEIGEAAVFLLKAAVLASVAGGWVGYSGKQAAAALAFTACNVALWIAWSGEWVEDVFIGAAFGWYVYTVIRALATNRALNNAEWAALGIGCALLLLGQGLALRVPAGARATLDGLCYLLLAAGVLFWACKWLRARRRQVPPVGRLCLAFALLCWAIMAKYMSDGLWYYLFLLIETLCLPPLYRVARRVVAEA